MFMDVQRHVKRGYAWPHSGSNPKTSYVTRAIWVTPHSQTSIHISLAWFRAASSFFSSFFIRNCSLASAFKWLPQSSSFTRHSPHSLPYTLSHWVKTLTYSSQSYPRTLHSRVAQQTSLPCIVSHLPFNSVQLGPWLLTLDSKLILPLY